MGLPTAEKIVKLKVSKACFLFLTRGLRLDPKGISFSWNGLFKLMLTACVKFRFNKFYTLLLLVFVIRKNI